MSLDFDACFEAVRVRHNKRIRVGVSQPAAHAQPSTQSLFEQIVEEMARDARTHLRHARGLQNVLVFNCHVLTSAATALDTFKGVDFAVAAALKARVMLLTVVG